MWLTVSGGDGDLMGSESWLLNVQEFCKSVPKPAGSLELDLVGVLTPQTLANSFFLESQLVITPLHGELSHSVSLGQTKPRGQ